MELDKIEIKKPTFNEIREIFINEWGADYIITKGNIIKYNDVKGFIAKEKNVILGLITYIKRKSEIEITSLNSFRENKGIGTLLLNKVIKKGNNRLRIFLITTDNNIKALKFYQKRKFIIKNTYKNSVMKAREIKPEIPEYDDNGIEIKDEIELEYHDNKNKNLKIKFMTSYNFH